MRIGIGLPAAIPGIAGPEVGAWAETAEEYGFDSVGVIDRLVYDNLDPLVALAAAAARTDRVELLTTVLNVPWRRNAVALAKQLASVDRLAGGRLTAGLALGGWPDDHEAAGPSPMPMGALMDEMLATMRRVWAGDLATPTANIPALPAGRPRLLFGGFAPAAFRRASRFGDGWVAPSFGIDALRSLPVMTKPDMMANFDDVCTDRRITRAVVDAHLAAVDQGPELLDGEFVVFGSGGSSGLRGLFVRHHEDLADYVATILRPGLAGVAEVFGWPPPFRLAVTMVAAPTALHATCGCSPVIEAVADVTAVPVALPFDEIVARVQASGPMLLVGYATVIARLADVAATGGMSISPQSIVVTSEELRPDLHDRIVAGFGMAPADSFASSEGLIGSAAPGSREFAFASDTAIVEFVDADDQPVDVGVEADHVLVTNLVNHVQPLIRYRIDDRMTPLPPSPDHGHQRALVRGRNDQLLHLGGVEIHPLVLRSTLLRFPAISEFQVHHDAGRPRLDVVTTGPLEVRVVEDAVRDALADAGAAVPVTVEVVPDLRRDPLTGKSAAEIGAF